MVIKLNIFLSLLVVIFLLSCGNEKGGAVNTIETEEEIIDMLNRDDVVILDVRTADEFAKGYLKNAINMDVVNNSNFIEDISEFNKNDIYLIYCARGTRSQMACSIMSSLGFKHLNNSALGYEDIFKVLNNQ